MNEKAKSPTRRVAEERAATAEEIRAAFDALTPIEIKKLEMDANSRVSVLGRKARGRSGDDLLQQAFHDIWDKKRRWDRDKVDFIGFLRGAIRSIASNWGSKYDREEAALGLGKDVKMSETPLYPNDDDEEPIPLPSMEADPERGTLAKIEVERIEQLVQEDVYACFILDGLHRGMTGPEIQRDLSITKNDFESSMKWIRQRVRD